MTIDDELLWNRADSDAPVLILAHGAGAAMDSDFMNTVAEALCEEGISVVRFEFDYMQERRASGKKRPPGRQPKLLARWQAVFEQVSQETDQPVFIGGKSMGGRMATLLMSELPALKVSGVVCLGYPFYAPGKQDKPRTEHLAEFSCPTLIVQGDRDAMGDKEAVSEYKLSETIRIKWLEDGNHDLKPRKVSGFTHEQHIQTAVKSVVDFIRQ